MRKQYFRLQWLMVFAAVLGISFVGASNASAGFLYNYSEQTLSNIVLSTSPGVTIIPGVSVPASTSSSAQLGGNNSSNSVANDATQSIFGPSPQPAENTFSPFANVAAPAGSQPTGLSTGAALDDFSRGDVLVTGNPIDLFSGGVTVNSVAESYLTSGANLTASSSGAWAISTNFKLSGPATFLRVNFNWVYLIRNSGVGGNSLSSSFITTFSLTNQNGAGGTGANSSTQTGSAVSFSGNLPGVFSISAGGFSPTDTFTLTITGNTQTAANLAPDPNPVPEPTTVAMMGMGFVAFTGFIRARRKAS